MSRLTGFFSIPVVFAAMTAAGCSSGPTDRSTGNEQADTAVGGYESDSSNCGARRHDCLGGACIAGACQPVALSTGQVGPTAIVTDRYNVYWTADSLMTAPLYGGEAIAIAPSAGASGLASDGSNLYWSGLGITAFHFDTGCVSQVAPGPLGGPAPVATDGVNVYYLDPGTSTVFQVSVAGGTPLALLQGEGYGNLATDGTNVYVIGVGQNGALLSVPVGGGSVTTLAASQYGQGIAIDDRNVYWTSFNPSLSGSNVAFMPKGGGTPTVLVGAYAAGNQPDALALDGDTLYWADFADNTIRRVSRNGGSPAVLATVTNGEIFQEASGLAVSRRAIYWTTLNAGDPTKSTVWMLAK